MAGISTAKAVSYDIRKIGNRSVLKIHQFGNGLIGFEMNTCEDGESEVTNGQFWLALDSIKDYLSKKGFECVPEGTMPLLIERFQKPQVDMVIPLRCEREKMGNFLKADHQHGGILRKKAFVTSQVRVEGERFIFLVMDPAFMKEEFKIR